MVTGIAMALLVGSTFFLFQFTQSSGDESALQQAAQIGYRVVDEAASMYVFGQDSFVHVTGSVPASIQAIYVVDEDTLVFEVRTSKGVVPVQVFSDVPINGTNEIDGKVHINPSGTEVREGNTRYRVTSQGSWVEIRQA